MELNTVYSPGSRSSIAAVCCRKATRHASLCLDSVAKLGNPNNASSVYFFWYVHLSCTRELFQKTVTTVRGDVVDLQSKNPSFRFPSLLFDACLEWSVVPEMSRLVGVGCASCARHLAYFWKRCDSARTGACGVYLGKLIKYRAEVGLLCWLAGSHLRVVNDATMVPICRHLQRTNKIDTRGLVRHGEEHHTEMII